MELLEALSKVVSREKFARQISKSPKLLSLYISLSSEYEGPGDDYSHLTDNVAESRDSLKQLKTRLKKRLLQHIKREGITKQSQDEYIQKYYEYATVVPIVQLLANSNMREAATQIAEQYLKLCMRSEYTDLSLQLLRQLLYYYGAIKCDQRKYKKYHELYNLHIELSNKENKAHQQYIELRMMANSAFGRTKMRTYNKAISLVKELDGILDSKVISYELLLKVYLSRLIPFEIRRDYGKIIEICKHAIEKFSKRRVSREVGIYLFKIRVFISYIYLKKYIEAKKLSRKYLRVITVGTSNWYAFNIYRVILSIRLHEYLEAQEAYNIVLNSKKYTRQSIYIRELYKIYGAYLYFISLKKNVEWSVKGEFRIYKFLNELPHYSKDKRGINIAILVIQFMFLLQKRKYSQVIDRVEALNQYCHRYLRRDETFRSHCFIKMLLQIPRADFNRIRTERYAAQYVKKLQSMPIGISEQSIEVEVVPYEDMWEMALDLLD